MLLGIFHGLLTAPGPAAAKVHADLVARDAEQVRTKSLDSLKLFALLEAGEERALDEIGDVDGIGREGSDDAVDELEVTLDELLSGLLVVAAPCE